MKKRIGAIIAVVLLLTTAGVLLFTRREPAAEPRRESHFALGTVVSLTVYRPVSQDFFTGAFALVDEYEQKLSRNLEGSEISAVNRAAGEGSVAVSPETWDVIEEGLRYSRLSAGAFDITIGPLVSLWGIGTEAARVPEEREIDDALSLIDYQLVSQDEENRRIYLPEPGMALDPGAIAKGYIADRLAEYCLTRDIGNAIINLGGNILTLGTKPDGSPYRIGIQDPFSPRGSYIGIVTTADRSVVSSGVYERFFEKEGIRYHHILDTGTGRPVRNSLMGVSIISERSVDGDGLSTSVFALGLKQGRDLIESLDGVEAVFITDEKKVYNTTGLTGKFSLTAPSFTAGDQP